MSFELILISSVFAILYLFENEKDRALFKYLWLFLFFFLATFGLIGSTILTQTNTLSSMTLGITNSTTIYSYTSDPIAYAGGEALGISIVLVFLFIIWRIAKEWNK